MLPTCAECDDRYPEGAVHESCANARVYEEGGGWLWDRPRTGVAPAQSGDVLDDLWWSARIQPSAPPEVIGALGDLAAAASGATGPRPPYCGQCEWDGMRLIRRCAVCANEEKS